MLTSSNHNDLNIIPSLIKKGVVDLCLSAVHRPILLNSKREQVLLKWLFVPCPLITEYNIHGGVNNMNNIESNHKL